MKEKMENNIVTAKRDSGIELLRIVAILGVIMIHFYEAAGDSLPWLNHQILLLLRTLSSASVDVFLIISGFFLCNGNKRKVAKIIDLVLQVSIYNEIAYLIEVYCGIWPLSFRSIVSSALPDCYYTILFVVLYLISPYINIVINSLSKKEFRIFLTVVFLIFSVYAIGVDLLNEIVGQEIVGLSSIGAWGSQSGFTIVNFSLLYSLGAYLRLHGFPNLLVKRGKIIAILLIALIALWAELNQFLPNFGMDSAWKYNNPLVILYAVILFGFFLRLKISSSFINSAAKIVYPLFLIHCCVIKHINISYYCQKSFYDIVFCYLVFSFSMYILSWLVYYLYKRTVGLFIYKMFSYNIDFFRMKESNVKC